MLGSGSRPALSGPLAGLRVLDLTVALAGPYSTLLLAGLGAEVIRIEGPDGGDVARTSPPFFGSAGFNFDAMQEGDISISQLLRGRGKKSLSLNLKTPEGLAIFRRLASLSDILVENLSEGTASRLGVGYDDLQPLNPSLIYCSIMGLGENNPYPGVKGMDILVQALSGLMDVTGFQDGPPTRVGLPIADLVTPLFALTGLLSAVIQRGETGVGQHVKVSMIDCLTSLVASEHFDLLRRNGLPARTGNHMNRIAPFGLFRTRDGYVAIAAAADKWVGAIFDALGQPDLIRDPRFSHRGARIRHADEMNAIIEAWTRTLPTSAVIDELSRRDVACAPLRSVEEALQDPWLRRTGAVKPLEHPDLGLIDAVGPGVPISFSAAGTGFNRAAVRLGADNSAILQDLLGLTQTEIAKLADDRVI